MLPRAWLSRRAREAMTTEATARFPLETGGVLVGYWGDGDVVLVDAVGPGPRAVHLPQAFEPDQRFHERAVRDAYLHSERRFTYLGDWHSHPRGSDHLSNLDVAVLRKIADSAAARAPMPLMAIVCGGPLKWQIIVRTLLPSGRFRLRRRTSVLPLVDYVE